MSNFVVFFLFTGIMNVSAVDKGSGKSEKITIKNNKGRLSREEIDKMLSEAERFAEDDKKQREKVQARNHLESYVFGVKQAVDDAPADKIPESDKQKVLQKCQDTLKWLDNNLLADKEEYEYKLKELESECKPVMMKMHGNQGGPQGFHAGGQQARSSGGPTVEEVD